MQTRVFHRFSRAPAILVPMLVLALGACGGAGSNAADHGVELPDDLASVLPMPAEASIMTTMAQDDIQIVMFRPGLAWPEVLEFFSKNLPAADWEVAEEQIPEDERGERTAKWRATGHGWDLDISITAFGGRSGMNMTGHVTLEPAG